MSYWIISLSVAVVILVVIPLPDVDAEKKVVCYHGTWATYRHGNGRFGVENIDPFLCTHLMYAFFGITSDGRVKILDPYLDLEENWGRGNIKKFNHLKTINPNLKTLAAIGGWNEKSKPFSLVANDPQLRQNFATDVTNFALEHGFDGIDLDWEYPAQLGGDSIRDKNAFTLLIMEMKMELSKHNLLLSAAVASAEFSATLSYDIPQVVKYLDFINVMTYDFHGAWDTTIGINAPLYQGSADVTPLQRQLNTNASISYWISQGAPAEKLVLGIPFYGRSFALRSQNLVHPGSPHNGPGMGGPYTSEPGNVGFNELCEIQVANRWNRQWEPDQKVPYIFRDSQWIGYDDMESIGLKVEYLNEKQLGGAMVWAIETDDFHNLCGFGPFPLLNLINDILGNDIKPITTTTDYSTTTEISSTKPTTTLSTDSTNSSQATTTPETTTDTSLQPETSTEPTTTNTSLEPETSTELTTQDPQNTFECKKDGTFRDPHDCSVYYVCIYSYKYKFICPFILRFDLEIMNCNWPHLVDCA